jgi:Fic family protein
MRVIQRKGYHYLIHSFRKEGKVVTREKYLGKEVPEDLEVMKEQFLRECMREDLFKRLDLIKREYQREWNKLPASVKKKRLLELAVEFTYNTNAIEGSTITLDETEDLIERKIAPHKPVSDVQETLAHSEVFLELMESPPEVSIRMILKWHRQLFGETKTDIAGKFRDYLVRVGNYVAPDWQDVEKLMKDFVGWCRKNKDVLHPVELAARAHYQFEKIHPFGDGNGRVGRLIIATLLQKQGYPLLIIEYKRRQLYYRALSKSESDFFVYFVRRYIRQYKWYGTSGNKPKKTI